MEALLDGRAHEPHGWNWRRLVPPRREHGLGLTEQQPENNVYRILIEALAVTLSKDARCRALQLPAWNEALGLPRPWDQQWSLRLQQVLAYETDLLEYEDLFDGSHVVEAKVVELSKGALEQLALIDAMGGAQNAIDYMKTELVGSNAKRVRSVETGDLTVVGVNRWTDTEVSPLSAGEGSIETVDPRLEADVVARLKAWREARDDGAVQAALADLQAAARDGRNVMEPSIVAAKAGVTTGEWAGALRAVFGEYRGPTGVAVVVSTGEAEDVEAVTGAGLTGHRDGRRLRLGRPGWLDAGPLADQVAAMQAAGATAVLVEDHDQLIGAIAVRDELRPEAAQVVAALRRGGYRVAMLTGDNSATATALATSSEAIKNK